MDSLAGSSRLESIIRWPALPILFIPRGLGIYRFRGDVARIGKKEERPEQRYRLFSDGRWNKLETCFPILIFGIFYYLRG